MTEQVQREKFLPDPEATGQRLAELLDMVRFAEYELGAAVTVARHLGMTWEQIGEALGYAEGGRKQGARQFFQRAGRNIKIRSLIDHHEDAEYDEYERLCRLIDARERVVMWEVRVITSGKPGVTRVTRTTISRHKTREVAEEHARKRDDAEVWRVPPAGKPEQMPIRRRRRPTEAREGEQTVYRHPLPEPDPF